MKLWEIFDRTFLGGLNFHEKSDAMAKNFLKCVSNLFFYVLPQKLNFWVKRIMPDVTSVGAVVDPPLSMRYH